MLDTKHSLTNYPNDVADAELLKKQSFVWANNHGKYMPSKYKSERIEFADMAKEIVRKKAGKTNLPANKDVKSMEQTLCQGCGIRVGASTKPNGNTASWCNTCRPILDYHLNEHTKIIAVSSRKTPPSGAALIFISKRQVRPNEPVFYTIDFVGIGQNELEPLRASEAFSTEEATQNEGIRIAENLLVEIDSKEIPFPNSNKPQFIGMVQRFQKLAGIKK